MGKRITQDECLNRFVACHGNKYCYDDVVYIRQSEKVRIRCKACNNDFMQLPEKHWIGQGCPHCKGESISRSKRIDKDEFIKRCRAKGFLWFDESCLEYVSSSAKAEFRCLSCDSVNTMKPNNVMSGKACLECAKRSFGGYSVEALERDKNKASKPCTLYHIKIFDGDTYLCDKIGVTTVGVEERFKSMRYFGYSYKIVRTISDTLINFVGLESIMKESILTDGRALKKNIFRGSVKGWTECFLDKANN